MGKLSKLNSRLGQIQKMNKTPQKKTKKLNEKKMVLEKSGASELLFGKGVKCLASELLFGLGN